MILWGEGQAPGSRIILRAGVVATGLLRTTCSPAPAAPFTPPPRPCRPLTPPPSPHVGPGRGWGWTRGDRGR